MGLPGAVDGTLSEMLASPQVLQRFGGSSGVLYCLSIRCKGLYHTSNHRVLVRGFNLSYHNIETILFTMDPQYGNLNRIPQQKPRSCEFAYFCQRIRHSAVQPKPRKRPVVARTGRTCIPTHLPHFVLKELISGNHIRRNPQPSSLQEFILKIIRWSP